MLRGRILIVSDEAEVIAELDPIIRDEGHLTLRVSSASDVLNVFDEGIIPDIVISQAREEHDVGDLVYLSRFHQLNQLGQHMVVSDGDRPLPAPSQSFPSAAQEPFAVLTRPFSEDRVRSAIQAAMGEVRRGLESLRAEMFREAARMQKAIRDAQLEMVTAIALMMEAKDPYMRGHCERVSELARMVAEEMGVPEDETERLGTAALVHEIGKISVPLAVLHKAGKITEEELRQVRAHSQIGAQIVKAVPSLTRVARLIETQYTDYAELGDQIPLDDPEHLLASILRIVDSYDALTSQRSHRGALDRTRWVKILRSGSGSQFHPEALDAFFAVESRLADKAA